MKKLLFLIILNASFLIPNSFCGAYPEPDLKIQNKNISDEPSRTIDSLLALLKKDNADTNKVTHLTQITH